MRPFLASPLAWLLLLRLSLDPVAATTTTVRATTTVRTTTKAGGTAATTASQAGGDANATTTTAANATTTTAALTTTTTAEVTTTTTVQAATTTTPVETATTSATAAATTTEATTVETATTTTEATTTTAVADSTATTTVLATTAAATAATASTSTVTQQWQWVTYWETYWVTETTSTGEAKTTTEAALPTTTGAAAVATTSAGVAEEEAGTTAVADALAGVADILGSTVAPTTTGGAPATTTRAQATTAPSAATTTRKAATTTSPADEGGTGAETTTRPSFATTTRRVEITASTVVTAEPTTRKSVPTTSRSFQATTASATALRGAATTEVSPGGQGDSVRTAQADSILRAVESVAAGVVSRLGNGTATRSTLALPVGLMTAMNLGSGAAQEVSVSAETREGEVCSVKLPQSALEAARAPMGNQEPVVLVVTVFDSDSTSSLGGPNATFMQDTGMSSDLDVLAAVNVDLRGLLSGEDINITGLREPIVLTLPANFTPGLACAFWDADEGVWSSEGVAASADNVPGEPLVCLTTHLTLFAAIMQGFVVTFQCSQIALFSMEGLEQFTASSWYSFPGTLLFWALLLVILASFLVAAWVDQRRASTFRWTEDYLLVPGGDDFGPEVSFDPRDTEQRSAERQVQSSWFLTGFFALGYCLVFFGNCLCSSSSLRDAIDDILSAWCAHASEIRTLGESVCQSLEVSSAFSFSQLSIVSQRITNLLLLQSSRRLTGSSLHLSDDLVLFVINDEDLKMYLNEGEPDHYGSDWRLAAGPREGWTLLQKQVARSMMKQLNRSTCRNLPIIIWEIFKVQNPFGRTYVFDLFVSCKMRTLFFLAEMLGSLTLASAFFQASGDVNRKLSRRGGGSLSVSKSCTANAAGSSTVGFRIGRLFAIAMASAVLASLPLLVLESLRTKGFKRMGVYDDAAWARKLRAWRAQDRIVWSLGLLYVAFCTFYIDLLLANILEKDHRSWSYATLVTVVQEFVVLPLLLSVCAPLLSGLMIFVQHHTGLIERRGFVRQARETVRNNVSQPGGLEVTFSEAYTDCSGATLAATYTDRSGGASLPGGSEAAFSEAPPDHSARVEV